MTNRRQIAVMLMSVILPGVVAFTLAEHRGQPAESSTPVGEVGGVRADRTDIAVGTVFSGGGVHVSFRLTNQNAHPVHIDSITSDCGCTVPGISNAIIPPGGALDIPVSYFPPEPQAGVAGGEAGGAGFAFQRTVTIHFRAPSGDQHLPLTLTGFVAADRSLRIFPLAIDLGDVRAGQTYTRILHLKGDASIVDAAPESIQIAPGDSTLVQTAPIPSDSTAPIHQRDIPMLICVPPGAPSGNWTASVRFAPDAASAGLAISIAGNTLAAVSASVASVILSAGGQSTASVELASTDGRPLGRARIQTDLPLQCQIADVAPDRCSLQLALNPGSRFQGAGNLQITFDRDGKTTDSISLPVVIFAKESQP